MRKNKISHLQVLKSNAGYYIGRTIDVEGSGHEEPYSRESFYIASRELAEEQLINNTYIERL